MPSLRRPDFVIDATFDLFCDLCATDEQCDFPVVYASGVNGIAGGSPAELADDLAPLFEAIVREVRARERECAAKAPPWGLVRLQEALEARTSVSETLTSATVVQQW